MLDPGEVGGVEIILDGRRFVGHKTKSFWLTVGSDTIMFTIKACTPPR